MQVNLEGAAEASAVIPKMAVTTHVATLSEDRTTPASEHKFVKKSYKHLHDAYRDAHREPNSSKKCPNHFTD